MTVATPARNTIPSLVDASHGDHALFVLMRRCGQTHPVPSPLSDYAHAVPINAIRAYGLGPAGGSGARPVASLQDDRQSARGAWYAMESIGATAQKVASVLISLGDSATAEQLAFQTRGADPDDLADALDRLVAADLIVRDPSGDVAISGGLVQIRTKQTISLGDQYATTSDVLARICRTLRITAPSRKQERADAISAAFADPSSAAAIRSELSGDALQLAERVAAAAGPTPIHADEVGLPAFQIRHASPSPYSYTREIPSYADPSIRPLAELAARGIVGIADYDGDVWIWSEAWALLDRPFYDDWPVVVKPATIGIGDSAARLPSIVGRFDQVLRAWEADPPPVLKSGQRRIGKTQIRATAKALQLDAATVDVAGRLAIGIELLLPNVISSAGRGRNRRVEQAWLADEALIAAWNELPAAARWVRLVAEWCDSFGDVAEQAMANRQLVLWELARLDETDGYADAEAFRAWIAHHHGPTGNADHVAECLDDLRALGLIPATGPLALTAVARLVLDDPVSVLELDVTESTSAIVQADLTVVAPPDLHHDLACRLAAYAEVETDSGAVISRLSLDRITHAVQAGESADDIVAFLTELSSVPIADTVVRLVHDAAARAGRVRVISAPTVVVVNDPADLTLALSVKAAKLTKISDTVAVTEVAYGKVRTALDRKGLAPESIVASLVTGSTAKKSSVSAAKAAADEAERVRAMAAGSTNDLLHQHADRLATHAERLADVSGQLAVQGPLALTPALVARLDDGQKKQQR